MLTKVTDTVSLAECLSKFSSWSKAIKAVAHLIRRAKKIKSNTPASVSEQENAEHIIIRDVQTQTYGPEIKLLDKGKPLPHHNKLFKLDVFMDTDGLLKVGGRLQHSPINDFQTPNRDSKGALCSQAHNISLSRQSITPRKRIHNK